VNIGKKYMQELTSNREAGLAGLATAHGLKKVRKKFPFPNHTVGLSHHV
jgi:hypothetical protein